MSRRIFWVISCLAAILFSLQTIKAAPQIGPLDRTGSINGAAYRIVVPAQWNGTLLVYGHGYRDRADQPGEVDNRNPDIAPNAEVANVLLAQGFALAGSAYKQNGWAVEEGIVDLRDLTLYFEDQIAEPDRTILWAFSMGTVIGFRSMELYPELYDGALCACAVGAGATQSWDSAGDLALAYDTVFGMPAAWGTFADVRDNIDFETQVQPKLISEVTNAANFPRFEFVRLVAGTPGRGITPPAPPNFYPGWVFTDMYFTTEARAELERRAGGAFVQNLNRNYNLTAAERAYLNALGVPSAVIDGWLAAMNGRRNAFPSILARDYVERNANYTGRIRRPVLTLHTIIDPLVTVTQEYEYKDTVVKAGRGDLLYQTYTTGNGHCAFTGPQLLTAVAAIEAWVKFGIRPDTETFPAILGFAPFFVPPPMNQP
jgi:pimeloyl-ACP methyl ester carboxylesterase